MEIKEKVGTHQLPLMEDFYTVQGEGHFQGQAAYFIRLAGCDVGCVWCDVKDSWDVSAHPQVTISEIVQRVKSSKAEIVVVTGGEPAMHDLSRLTDVLHEHGFRTHIETSGVYKLSGKWDWICFSPKKFLAPDPAVFLQANELKVIIYNRADFAWAEEFVKKVSPECLLFLQPEWSKSGEMTPLIVDYVKEHPYWKISLQIHKFMNIP